MTSETKTANPWRRIIFHLEVEQPCYDLGSAYPRKELYRSI